MSDQPRTNLKVLPIVCVRAHARARVSTRASTYLDECIYLYSQVRVRGCVHTCAKRKREGEKGIETEIIERGSGREKEREGGRAEERARERRRDSETA